MRDIGQWVWPETWHLPLPDHNPAAAGITSGDAGHLPEVPRQVRQGVLLIRPGLIQVESVH